MAGSVLTYSPSDVSITISGYALTGLLRIELAWNTAPFAIVRGIRGINTRRYNRDLSAKLTVDVMQTSVTNTVLAEILAKDRLMNGARLDLTLSDASGRSTLQTAEAYITAVPDLVYSMGFDARRWVFDINSVTDGTLTGSADQQIDLFSSNIGTNILNNITGRVASLF